MKKLFSILLAVVLTMSLLAGCAGSGTTVPTTTPTTTATPTTTEATTTGPTSWTGEISKIIMTYLTLGVTPKDLDKVVSKVNEISKAKVGVEVEFKAISAYDAFTEFPLWISTGEQVDLMMPLLQNLSSFVSQGMILPLDELLAENAPAITRLDSEGFPLILNNIFNDEVYAVATIGNVYGMGAAYFIDKPTLQAAGVTPDESKIYSLDDMTTVFAALKAKSPSTYPAGIGAIGYTNSSFTFIAGIADNLAASQSSGVLLGTDGTTIVNLFESAEYKAYLDHLHAWNKAGYIYPDAATTDTSTIALVAAGTVDGYFMASAPIQRMGTPFGTTTDQVAMFKLSPVYQSSQGAGGWVVPITAAEPEAAIRFLDLTFADPELCNLIQWGIEGEHYVVKDKSINLVGFPDGVDGQTSGYYNTLGLYGDQRFVSIWDPNNDQAKNDAYTAEAMKNKTKAIGYRYDPTAKAAQITAITAVVAQYLPALETGSVDLNTYYPEFIAALKSAGIDEIIADNQAQFDDWLAK
ncbi:MAG TPA: hypothetical protein DCM45_03350 [Clostridiales bacterium]|nr:hypothetical protein [Clostridiales bacterium]